MAGSRASVRLSQRKSPSSRRRPRAAAVLAVLGVVGSAIVMSAAPARAARATSGLVALYEFNDGSGTTVADTSGYGTALNLTVADPASVRWNEGVLSVSEDTVIEAASSSAKIRNAVVASNEVTLEAWVDPADTTQTGPARIVSISSDPYTRNITLGQGPSSDGTRAEVRLRTTATDSNGLPGVSSASGTLKNRLTHLVYTRDNAGAAKLYIDGAVASTATVGGNLSNWDSALPLLLGNEDTGDRPWLGDLHLVAFYDRDLSATEVAGNYADGPDPGGTASNDGIGQRSFSTFTDLALTDRSAVHVNAASGNAWYSAADVRIAGRGLDLAVGRHYNSRSNRTGAFGDGWTIDAGGDIALEAATGGGKVLHGPTGYRATFSPASGGAYTTPSGLDATLTSTGGGFSLRFDRTGEVWSFTSAGRLTSRADRNGNTIAYAYDSNGRLDSITDTRGRVLDVSTDTAGRITALQDVAGRVWSYGYTNGRLTTATDPELGVTGYRYNPDGTLAQITNTRGQVTAIGYDRSRRVISVARITDPTAGQGPEHRFVYTAGQTVVTDPNGHDTTYAHDGSFRVTSALDARGNETETTYTANSNVATYTPASQVGSGTPVTNGYSTDGRNNLTSVAMPTGAETTFAYTDTDNLFAPSSTTSPQGGTLSYDYDTAGNLTTVSDDTAAAGTTTVDRNPDGSPDEVTDPNGNVTGYSYNSDGELTGIDHPAPLGDEAFEYDDLSRVTARTDGKNQRVEFTYDDLDRVTEVDTGAGLVATYTYDPAGNRTQRVDPNDTLSSTYDLLNRVTAEDRTNGADAAYGYDPAGNLLTLEDPGGEVTYTYNEVNLVDSVTDPASNVITFEYDDDNNRFAVHYPNDVSEYSFYDASGRLTNQWALFDDGVTTNYFTYFSYGYTDMNANDTMLRQTSQDITGNTTTWFYDELDRLVGGVVVDGSTWSAIKTYEWTYDAAGNRLTDTVDLTTKTAAYNTANQLCWMVSGTSSNGCATPPTGAVTYTYDANGNQTANSNGLAFAYNALDQTTTITPPGASPVATDYAATGQTERTAYTDSQGSTTRAFEFTDTILGLTAREQTNPAGTDAYTRDPAGGLLARRTASGPEYYVTDGLGSIVAATDDTGAATRTYTYDPWGRTTTSGVTGFDDNPWRYAAGYQDNNTGLVKFGTRYYDPTVGLWTQHDPIAGDITDPNTTNLYTYVGNNPTNTIDPTGAAWWNPFSWGDDTGTEEYISDCLIYAGVGGLGGAVFGGLLGAAIGAVGGCAAASLDNAI